MQLTISTLYGAKTRQARVQITIQDTVMQLSAKDAREIALQILVAAESAEQDGFLVEWGQEKVGLDTAGSAQLVSEFRKWREQNSLS